MEGEKFYVRKAEEFIDVIFDKGYFHEDVKRDDLRKLDDLFGYMLQTTAESAVKCAELSRRIRERKQ